ncbi:unnamed protein product [Cyprideis torosa]|uniref:Uncharacterized protein n=1 Tax=Cyprideis torosa TaxID=163714 RepID=A0A7R8ZIZ9_9CRUS|nr:unnamed protein product [Cyprideis torosa]CAG0885840.1 unnamed protein product [Cyprideis torosa]
MDSDEETDTRAVPRAGTIHYGSLEESERMRLKERAEIQAEQESKRSEGEHIHRSTEYIPLENRPESGSKQAVLEEFERRKRARQIQVSTDDVVVRQSLRDLDEPICLFGEGPGDRRNRPESGSKQAVLEEFERRKRARQIQVSTDDVVVRQSLRDLDEPICLFGEGPGDRRNRLRDLLSRIGTDALEIARKKRAGEEAEHQLPSVPTDENITWYHEGPPQLKDARIWLARYSFPRAKHRIAAELEERKVAPAIRNAQRQELQKKLTSEAAYCSQIGDTRPISYCRFSPNWDLLATASWSGLCQLWTVPGCESVRKLRGHQSNVTCVSFNPVLDSPVALASSGTDGSVKLWDNESEDAIVDLDGHHGTFRVSRVKFHPSGRFFVTCVADKSWRLWDLESQQELLHQEGHTDAVHDCSFHPDGSLIVTGSMDSFARLWDLRTGQCVMLMCGHLKSVLSLDFSPNGYLIATGSEDNSCKIWDIRKRAPTYTIPAHTNLVSSVRFEPMGGKYLVTTSYDKTSKIWLYPFWQPLKTLTGHDNKVMCCDVTQDWIVTSAFDRTFKLWAPEHPTAGPKKKITVKLDMEKLKDPFFNPLAEYFPEAHQQQKGLVYDKKPFRYTCEAGKAYKWCACGHSKSQPFCDNSHSIAGLKCNIRPVPFMAVEKKSVWFCNCKQTAHPPFCDGTHRRVEIQTLSLEAPKPLTTTED